MNKENRKNKRKREKVERERESNEKGETKLWENSCLIQLFGGGRLWFHAIRSRLSIANDMYW